MDNSVDNRIGECIMSKRGVRNEKNGCRIDRCADVAIVQEPVPSADLTQIKLVVVDLSGFEGSIRDASSS